MEYVRAFKLRAYFGKFINQLEFYFQSWSWSYLYIVALWNSAWKAETHDNRRSEFISSELGTDQNKIRWIWIHLCSNYCHWWWECKNIRLRKWTTEILLNCHHFIFKLLLSLFWILMITDYGSIKKIRLV